jgi:hypothetical protein
MLQYAPLRIDVDKAMQHQCFADLHQGKHAEALRGACDEPLDACSETDVASLDAHMVDDVAFITSQHAPMQDAESGAIGSECLQNAAHDAQPPSARRRRTILKGAITPFNSPTGSAGKRKQQKRHIRDRDQPIIASLHSPSRP